MKLPCLASSIPAYAGAGEPDLTLVVDRERFDAMDAKEPGVVVDNGDGTWSYAPPKGFDPELLVADGIVTWGYVGQAKYAWEPKPLQRYTYTERAPEDLMDGRGEYLWRMVQTDRLGRQWKVSDVDDVAWDALLAAQPKEPVEPREPAKSDTKEVEVPVGTEMTVEVMSWDNTDCDNDSSNGNEVRVWEGEDRVKVESPIGRQRALVRVELDGYYKCTGTLVKNRWVLTAAHCVTDDNGDLLDGSFQVRDYEGEITAASSISFPEAYNGNGAAEPRDDWALIYLNSWYGDPPGETMGLSSASDSTLEALTITRELGYPAHWMIGSTCWENTSWNLFRCEEDEPIAQVQSDSLRMKIDASPGNSGGPWYFCPEADDDECLSGEPGMIYGVVSGFNQLIDRAVGAKVPYFRADALAIINE